MSWRRGTCLLFLCGGAVVSSLWSAESTLDIGLAALKQNRELDPRVDVASGSAVLDRVARQVLQLARGSSDPDIRVRALNTVIHTVEKFKARRDSVVTREPRLYSLAHLLTTKEGNCFTMPFLYVAVAERLGWPVKLVHVPDHAFVRYVDPTFPQGNIEATSGGGFVADDRYAADFRVSARGRHSGAYLRSLENHEVMADLLAVNAVTLSQLGEWDRAVASLERATKINPRFVDGWANLARAYEHLAKRSSGAAADTFRRRAAECVKKRDELGFVDPRDVPVVPSQK